MARVIHDTFTEAGASNVTLTDHVGEQGATWLPRADYLGEIRVKSASAKQAFSNALMTPPALNYASAQPSSADFYARIGLNNGATAGTQATGTVTLTGGAAGSINTVTVNGVNIIPSGAVPFDTSLIQTATDLAGKINADTLSGAYAGVRYSAQNFGTAVVTIFADSRTGTLTNGYVVATTTTTITTTTANMAGGTQGTLPDSIVGFCYRIQDVNTFYRVRPDPTTALWTLEKVIAGAVTVLATAIGRPCSSSGQTLIAVSVLGSVHTIHIRDALAGSYGAYTLTATDSSITANGAIGLWGSGGGTTSGSPPTEFVTKGVYFDTTTYDFEVGSNDIAVTLPAMGLAIAGTVGTVIISVADTPVGGAVLGGAAPVADVYNTVTAG